MSLSALTAREKEVVELVAHGFTNKQIGGQLGISERTVEAHVGHACRKMEVLSKGELALKMYVENVRMFDDNSP